VLLLDFSDLYDSNSESSQCGNNTFLFGKVIENWDKDFPGHLKVEYMFQEKDKNKSALIPIISPYAFNGGGVYFMPEKGSEVIIISINNKHFVLGCLWNKNENISLPVNTANEKNTVKSIKTKGGHEISFNEEDKKAAVKIRTPKNLEISVEDENEVITISNTVGSIKMSGKTIKIDTEDEISLCIGGKAKVTVNKSGVVINKGITVKDTSVTIKSTSVDIKADSSVTVDGGKTAVNGKMVDIKSDTVMNLKGMPLKLN
jgi:hypothetical protein